MSIKKPGVSLIFSLLVIGLLFSNACTSGNPNETGHVNKDITVKEAHQMIRDNSGNENFIILDTRTPAEFNQGHIENSAILDYRDPAFKQELEKLDRNKKYLVYCRSGNRSGKTLNMMKKLGFKEAYNMKGGILAWSKAGYELIK